MKTFLPELQFKSFLVTILSVTILCFCGMQVQAQVSVTPASGGTNISADKAVGSGGVAYTSLGNIQITESLVSDFSTGFNQLVLNAPTGWEFQPSGVTVSATGSDITTISVATQTASAITISLSINATADLNSITVSGLAVRSTDGSSIPNSGNITPSFTGTINGLNTISNLGDLSQVAGNAYRLALTSQPGNTTYGAAIGSFTVITQDQFNNPTNSGLPSSHLITATLTAGSGALTGTTSLNIGTGAGNGNGTVVFSNAFATVAGNNKIITIADGVLQAATSAAFNVTQAPLTITPTAASKTYGTLFTTGPGSTAFTSSGLQNAETIGSITITSTGAGTGAAVGAYPIVGSAATGGSFNAANYNISYVDGTLTVTQAPTSVSVTSSPNTSCFGSPVTLTATVSPNTATGTVEFFDGVTSLGTAIVSGGTASFITSSLTVGTHNNIRAQYLGDVNYAGSTSSDIQYTVQPLVAPSVSISTPTTAICAGTSVTFTATPINGGATPSYQWLLNGSPVGSNSNTYTNTNPVQDDEIQVILTPDIPCPSPATASSNVITMTVNPIITPTVSIISTSPVYTPNPQFCPGTSVTFQATPNNGGTLPVYQWKLNGTINVGTNSNIFITSTLVDGDVITVEMTSNAVCASPATVTSTPIPVSVNPAIPATPGTIAGQTTVCPGVTTLTYTIATVPNATSYTWTVPTGWTITANSGTSITVTSATTSGNISVTATNSCGTSPANSLAVTVSPATPATPGSISGNTPVCPGTSGLIYSISAVSNADANGYVWTVPAGWTITAGQGSTSITVTSGAAGANGNITVTASNSCGTSAAQVKAVSVSAATPATPGGITGLTTVCPGVSGTYSITPVATATSYTWTLPAGWIITAGATTNSITVTPSSTSGNVSVTAANSCGTSAASSLSVTVSPAAPATPGAIAGTTPVCPGITGLTYSIGGVMNANPAGYVWTVPTGWTITAGQGSTSITVTSGSAGQNGTITVTASNSCGTSSAASLPVTVSPATPATPATISGTATVCPGITGLTYSIPSVTNASSYTWTVPTGWTITANTGTSITVTSGGAGQNGNITVTATNSCGTSAASSLAVSVSAAAPATPGIIVGTTPVCPGIGGLTYSITAVTGATDYTWTVPTGWTITAGQGSTSITVTSGAAGQNGNISVTASNSCGAGVRTLAVVVSPGAPSTPAAITGATEQCINRTNLNYGISAVSNATSYNWTVPAGWSISSGQGTIAVVVATSGSAVSGNITVTAINSCGSSTAQTIAVTISTAIPANPGAITGIQSVCPVANGIPYSISSVASATSYLWAFPNAGWVLASGNNTNSITVNAGLTASAGNITVRSVNACGQSALASVLAISVGTAVSVYAGPDQTVCNSATTVAVDATPGGAAHPNKGTWYTSGTGTFQTPNNKDDNVYTFSAADKLAGSVILTFQTEDPAGTCGAQTDDLTVTIRPALTASISGTTTICSGSTATLTFTATPNTIVTFNPGSTTINIGASGVATYTTPTLTSAITYSLASIQYSTIPNCGVAVSGSATISISPTVNTNAGADQIVCATSPNVTLAGNISGGATTGTWSGGSGTFSPNNTTLNAVYTPTAAEIAAGTVTLTLTSSTPAVCPATSDVMVITINPAVITNAGADQFVCASSPNVTLAGTITGGATTGTWSGGAGAFNPNNTTLNAVYTPTASEIANGAVTLTLTSANPAGPCESTSDAMLITISPAATVSAGPAQTICAGTTATMAGSFGASATSATWSTSGSGTFNNNTPAAIYTPSATDISTGWVTLTYTTNDPPTVCGPVSASMILTINPVATVNAGPTQTICAGSTATMSGSFGGGASSATWTTSGSGTFNNNASPTAIYTPSLADIGNGIVTLTFTTNDPNGPCGAVSSSMMLRLDPAATVNAGPSFAICAGSTATMAASFGGGATFATWSTSGSGSFSNNSPTAVYTPSAGDVSAGSVTLTYTTDDPGGPAGPCPAASASMVLTINPIATVNAGIAQTICAGGTATMNGSFGGSASSATWSTSGTGSFNNNNFNAVYTPSAADIAAGSVILTYTTNDPAGPCDAASASIVLTINPLATVSAGANQTICSNTPATMAGSFGGGATSATWTSSGTGTFSNNTPTAIYTPSAADIFNGFVTLNYTTVDPAGPCGPATSSMILTIRKAVAITTQPSNVSVCASLPASLSVVATGDGLTYQWYKGIAPGGVAVANSANISGATSATLNFNNATLADDGAYYVIVSGASPCSPVTSIQAVLNVDQAIVITTQPVSQTVCVGTNPTISVVANANGDPLTYQWYINSTNSTVGGTSLGAAGQAASYSPVTTTPGVYYYYVLISGPSGYMCPTAFSNVVTLTVNPSPTITTQPSTANQAACLNGTVTQLSVLATGPGLTYQWYSNTTNSNSGGTSISGANGSTYTPSTTTPGTLYYYVVVTGTCAPSVTSAVSGAVTINTAPAITVQPSTATQTICLNGTATQLSVTANGAGVGYQWYSNTANSNSGGTLLTGATSSTYTPLTTTPGTLYYYVVVTGTCTPSVTSAVSGAVTINTAPAITSQPSTTPQSICLNGTATQLSVTATGAGLTYQWYSNTANSNSGGTSISGANGSTYTPSTTTPGTLYYYVVVTGTCSPSVTSAVSGAVTINTAPAITSQPSTTPQAICLNGTATQLSVTANGAGLSYQWYSNTTNSNSGGTSISGANGSTYTPSTTTPGTLYYYVVVTGTCSPAVTSAVSGAVTINTAPAITGHPSTTSQTLCSTGTAAQLSVTASGTGLTYQWYSNTVNSNSGGTLLTGATSSTYTPSTVAAGTLYYYVVVSGTCTPAVASNVSGAVTINAASVGGAVTQSSQSIIRVCSGGSTGQMNLAGHTGNVVRWESSTNAGGSWSPIANTLTTYTATNITRSHLFRAVVQNGSVCGLAYSSALQVILDIAYTPEIATVPNDTVCIGQNINLVAASYGMSGMVFTGGTFSQANPAGWNGADAGNNNENPNQNWGETNGPKTFNGVVYDSDGKFMIVTGNTTGPGNTSGLTTPTFSLIGLANAYLSFNQAFNLYAGASAQIQISMDNGGTWTTLQSYTGSGTYPGAANVFGNPANFDADPNMCINLNPYLGMTGLKLRFFYTGSTGSNWAVDNIVATNDCVGNPMGINVYDIAVNYSWTPATYLTVDLANNELALFNSTASGPGTFTYQVNATTTSGAACPSAAPANVTLVVNPLPTMAATTNSFTICSGTTDQIVLLPYTATNMAAPSTYSITWSSGPLAAVNNDALPANNISINVPANTAPGTYSGTITVTNGNGCNLAAGIPFTITVNNPPVIASLANPNVCFPDNASITATVTPVSQVGSYQWQQSSTGIAGSFTNMSNDVTYSGVSTNTLTFTNPDVTLSTNYYQLVVTGQGACPSATSAPQTLKFKHVWVGKTNTDWNTGTNWADGIVPDNSCDNVYIQDLPLKPVISAGDTGMARNLHLLGNTSLLVTGAGATLQVAGSIFKSAGSTLDLTAGKLELNGTSPQSITGDMFVTNTIQHLTNTNAADITIAGSQTLRITGGLGFGAVDNARTNSNGNIVLVSNASGTAWVADITNNNSNTGNGVDGDVTVERYINTPWKWQFLSVPTNTNQSINAAWQEGAGGTTNNPNPGYGTAITGPAGGTGFDFPSPLYSMKWSADGINFTPVTNTNLGFTNKDYGYYIYVRGDRSVMSAYSNSNLSTTLRTKATLTQGNYGSVSMPTGQWRSLGNPYASAIDFAKFRQNNTSINNEFYLWDPKQYGEYSAGGFVIFIYDISTGTYTQVPDLPATTSPSFPGPNQRIESGQAFYVYNSGAAANANFREHHKEGSLGRNVNRNPPSDLSRINANLYAVSNGNDIPLDGTSTFFSDIYSDAFDADDAEKLWNPSENFALFHRDGKELIVDARKPVGTGDTIHFAMYPTNYANYKLGFKKVSFDPTIQIWLIDKYLGTKTPVLASELDEYAFSIDNNAGSYAADRFKLVFKNAVALPVTFIDVKAIRNSDRSINVQWKVANEVNIQRYEVQRSADGLNFTGILNNDATNSTHYTKTDLSPLAFDNFYRIKAIGTAGDITYSKTVKVSPEKLAPAIVISPNPVKNGQMNIRFSDMPAGTYTVELVNQAGQLMHSAAVVVQQANMVKPVSVPKITMGVYHVVIRNSSAEAVHQEKILFE